MSHGSISYFTFAGFTLDLAKGRLMNGTGDVHLRAKSFALLSYLVRHTGRVVPKDELLSAIWPDVTVTEDSLTQCVRDVRKALGPEAAALLRTLPRRGYLFATDALQRPQAAVAPPVLPPAKQSSADPRPNEV